MFHVGAVEHRDEARVQDVLLKRPEHDLFESHFADAQPVGADGRAFKPCVATSRLGSSHHGETAAAAAAGQQEREQPLRPLFARARRALLVQLALHRFHAVPQLVLNDAQMRHVRTNPLGLVVDPAIGAAGVGILGEALATPDQLTDVELVVEDAGSAAAVTVDRAVAPQAAVLSADAFRVESVRDFAR